MRNTVNGATQQSTASAPGVRVFLGGLVNVFVNFDRLQLYSQHKMVYSYNL